MIDTEGMDMKIRFARERDLLLPLREFQKLKFKKEVRERSHADC